MTPTDCAFTRVATYDSVGIPMPPFDAGTTAQAVHHLLGTGTDGRAWWRPPDTEDWLEADGRVDAVDPDRLAGCRFFLDDVRVRALMAQQWDDLPTEDPIWPSATASFELHRAYGDVTFLSFSVGAWTAPPLSSGLRPPQVDPAAGAQGVREWPAEQLPDLLDHRLRRATLALTARSSSAFPTVLSRPRVRGRELETPVCYVVVPRHPPAAPVEWLSPQYGLAMKPVLQKVLLANDHDDRRLAAGAYPGGVLALYRRVEPSDAMAVRSYFMFLPSGEEVDDATEAQLHEVRALFELIDDARAHTSWDVDTELEKLEDRLADLQSIANDAGVVLDPLLRELLDPRADRFDSLREAVELVRTTLVQGGPELAAYRRLIEREKAKIDRLRTDYRTYFSGLGVGQVAGHPAIIDEFLGPLEEQRAQVDQTLTGQSRDVETLVASAAAVLAERREQNLATLSGKAYVVNTALFIFAVGTVVDLLVDFKWTGAPAALQAWLRGGVLALIVAGCVTLALMWAQRRSRALGDSRLTALRQRVVGLVQRLDLADRSDWPSADATLAAELAALWDELDEARARVERHRQDLTLDGGGPTTDAELGIMVEWAQYWSARAVLLGERPFPFATSLPLVTCFYHFREQGRFVSLFEFNQTLGWRPGVEEFRAAGAGQPREASGRDLLAWITDHLPPLVAAGGGGGPPGDVG